MRAATIIIGILDVVVAIAVTAVILKYSDPAFFGLDTFLIWAVPILALVTAVPAIMLAAKSQRPKSALALALLFPAGFGALLAGVFIYFTYFL